MTKRLSDSVIEARMIEWRNLKAIHQHDRLLIKRLKAENKQLKQELVDQRTYFESIIEAQNARITELETMIFGRRGKPRSGSKADISKVARNTSSYIRTIPPASAITQAKNIILSMNVITTMVH